MVADIITSLGGPATLSRVAGLPAFPTVLSWARRGSIPVRYWPTLIKLAATKRISLTSEQLMAAHSREAAQ